MVCTYGGGAETHWQGENMHRSHRAEQISYEREAPPPPQLRTACWGQSVFKARRQRRLLADSTVQGVISANHFHNSVRAVLLQSPVLWDLVSTRTLPEAHVMHPGGPGRCSVSDG